MPFTKIPGFKCKVYVSEENDNNNKKHPCKDCNCCQWCSDERCEMCLKNKKKDKK